MTRNRDIAGYVVFLFSDILSRAYFEKIVDSPITVGFDLASMHFAASYP